MKEKGRWKKALVISLILHGIILTVVGGLVASALKVPDMKEDYVELELANELDRPLPSSDAVDAASQAAGNSQAGSAAQVSSASAPVVAGNHTPSVEAVTGSMSVLSVETGGSGNNAGASSGREEGTVVSGGSSTASGTGSGQVGKRSGGIIAPGILSPVQPDYPEEARRAGVEGTVKLSVQILENGRAGQVTVYNSSGSRLLDNAAISAVEKWRFTPARERDSGTAIGCSVKIPIVFRLN